MTKLPVTISLIFALTAGILSAAGVYVNQLGYTKSNEKFVYTSDNSNSFKLVEAQTGNIVFTGTFKEVSSNDPLTGIMVKEGDFSEFTSEGKFYIKTEYNNSSVTFNIDNLIYNTLSNKTLKGFYFQRCGTQLLQKEAGNYQHLRCHTLDGTYHSTTGLHGKRIAKGGWHDAGDYGKYVVNAGISVGTLLLAYEMFPANFGEDNISIPESNNGIPDILDEIKYELDWLLTMQDTVDGGVYFKLTPEQFSGNVLPHHDNSIRYVYQKSSTATADFCAVMAMAYRIFDEFNPDYAQKCYSAALSAWQYLNANPGIVPVGGFSNPQGTNTGQYRDTNDKDERAWAAVELLKATGEDEYSEYFLTVFNNFGLFDKTLSWGNVKNLAFLSYMFNNAHINTTVISKLKNSLLNYCNTIVNISEANHFGLIMEDGDFNWGSNSTVMNNTIILIAGYEVFGNTDFYSVANKQLNYILGANAHNLSFVTGVGEKHVMHIHHRPSESDNITEPVPGLLAGGPNQNLNDARLQELFNSNTPPAMCYVDEHSSYASNEIAINWNAPLVFVAGYFASGNVSDLENKTDINNDVDFRINKNYPNPFNGTTVIEFYSGVSEEIKFKVYDILGHLVDSRELSVNKGDNLLSWTPDNLQGKNLCSGVYLYSFIGESSSYQSKMVFLK